MTPHTCVASGKIRRGFPFTVAMTGPDSWPGFFSTWMSRTPALALLDSKEQETRWTADLDRQHEFGEADYSVMASGAGYDDASSTAVVPDFAVWPSASPATIRKLAVAAP